MTLCILTSCPNHLATSVLAMTGRVIVYVYFLPGRWPLVSHVWCWTRSTPQPGHDVAGPCINTDSFKALAARVAAPGRLAAAMSLWQHSDSELDDSARHQDASEVLVPSQTGTSHNIHCKAQQNYLCGQISQ